MTNKTHEPFDASVATTGETGTCEPATLARETNFSRRGLLRGAASVSALTVGAGLLNMRDAEAFTARTAPATTSFTLAVLPDTQFYSRYATDAEHDSFQRQYGSTPFNAQTQFIVNNAKKYNIPFVLHLGDLVDQSTKPQQWSIADSAMKILENAKIPYSVCAGNHDVLSAYEYVGSWSQSSGTDVYRNNWQEPYIQWFPASRAAKQSTFIGRDGSGWHEAHKFTIYGVTFMVLSLSWRASNHAIAWANSMIAANPTLPVILVSHQLLAIDNDGFSPLEQPYGQFLWNNLIANNDQIFMTLNGHMHGGAHLQKINNFGNPVEEMVVDYQMAYQGGNALMRLYEFDFTNNKIDVVSFSPWVPQKPTGTLNQFDEAWLTTSNHQFTLPINFKKRFARFMNFAPVMATSGAPILPRVKQDLLANFTQPQAPVQLPPSDTNDYPVVAETVAHWRATGNSFGAAVPVGGILADVTGNNPMVRAPLSGSSWSGNLSDVVWSNDCHHLSAAGGSVRFLNTDKHNNHFSFFQTAATAPINAMTFQNGYTVEAFIKFDANWVAANNAWCNMLTRLGANRDIPNFWDNDPDDPQILFAISNLREVQWSVTPQNPPNYMVTNWSGEIMWNTWYHVAIVNDPVTKTTTMYIEGAPVMRNVANTVGISTVSASTPWALGCGASWGNPHDGFFGNIGEIRIVSKALTPDLWLTARRQST